MKKYKNFDQYLDEYLPKVKKIFKVYEIIKENQIYRNITDICRQDYPTSRLTTGLYYYNLKPWIEQFNSSNIMIVDGDEWIENPGALIEKVQEYLEIPKLLWKEDFVKNPKTNFFCYKNMNYELTSGEDKNLKSNKIMQCLKKNKGRTRKGARKMSDAAVFELKQMYAPFNEKLFKLTNRVFNWH